MPKDKTNLASEFFVLSSLHRLDGLDAYLTLGNKKSVDIVAIRNDGKVIDVEVKGVAGSHDWTTGQLISTKPESSFLVLVSYTGKFNDPTFPPEAWVLPYAVAREYLTEYKTKSGSRWNIKRSAITANAVAYKNNWAQISGGI